MVYNKTFIAKTLKFGKKWRKRWIFTVDVCFWVLLFDFDSLLMVWTPLNYEFYGYGRTRIAHHVYDYNRNIF